MSAKQKHSFTSDAHLFTSLWAHFGPFGDQSGHFHPCSNGDCRDAILVGEGRTCAGKDAPHKIKVYRGGRWVDLHEAIGATP